MPSSLVWGRVPDEVQMAMFRRKVSEVVHSKRPPLPPPYAAELVNEIMEAAESWEWWHMRWYGQWDDWEVRR